MQCPEGLGTPGFVFSACRMSAMFTFYMIKRAQGLFDPGCEPTLAGTEEKVLDMRKTAVLLLCLMVVPGFAHAAVDCSSTPVPQAAPLRPTGIAPGPSEPPASSYTERKRGVK